MEPIHPQPQTARPLVAADIASLAVIAGLAISLLLSVVGPPRLLLALLFVTAVPGWALVRAAGIASTVSGATMAVPLSLASCAGASAVMVWLGAWHPIGLFAILATASASIIIWPHRLQLVTQLTPGTRLQT